MNASNTINLLLSIVTVVASLVALYYSRKSIQLTEQSLKNTEESTKQANRPYLSMYIENIDTVYFSKHLVLKNFGKTSAKIIDIKFDKDLTKEKPPISFDSMIGGTIAPNQKFTTNLNDSFKELITCSISYQEQSGETHSDNFIIKTDMSSKLLWSAKEDSSDSSEATAIKKAAHAIIKAFK
ncbi:hypothetical protein ACFP65_08285 [Marinilactibacillus sp. GCM10026970]|uniref:hypothetical protein n=1 Tax=Marinilactibacillus sp. GCM10026970 TaxID=3252642 RepID=UPI0036177E16